MEFSNRYARDGHITSITQVIGHHMVPPKDDVVESGEMLETDRRDMSHPHEYGMMWYHRVVWVLHDMISGAAPLVSNQGTAVEGRGGVGRGGEGKDGQGWGGEVRVQDDLVPYGRG